MATSKSAKPGFGAKFMHWYESYQGKNITNIVYSAGASVVIIGALFKILHWPGASQVLMVGMFTEAFLFLIGTLEHPHPEFHWENVFPQLLGYGTNPELLEEKSKQARPTLLGAGSTEGAPIETISGGKRAEAVSVPSLKDEDLAALKDSIAGLAKTAAQLSELDKVARTGVQLGEKLAKAEVATETFSTKMTEAADAYVTKLSAAGAAADGLSQATTGLSGQYAQVSEEMKQVAANTRNFKAGVDDMGQKIATLNSVYELQLQALNSHLEAQKAQAAEAKAHHEALTKQLEAQQKQAESLTEAQKSATAAAKEAAEAQAAYTKETRQLQKQVADLNAIYGNMLNALA